MKKSDEYFKTLIKENERKIMSICHYYSNSDDDKKDLYQEILINIWQCLPKFRGESSISTWIYKIAVNTSITYANKEFKRLNIVMRWDDQKLALLTSEPDTEIFIKEKQHASLHEMLNQLNVIDKSIISLVLEKVSTKEIAEIIGITEPNVRVKIHRIKEQMKNLIKEENHDDK